MSDPQWTPGPWVRDTRGYPHPDVKAASGRNIACTWGVNQPSKTRAGYEAQTAVSRANAALIAAAPDLYAALAELLRVVEAMDGDNDQEPPSEAEYQAALAGARAALAKPTTF